MARKPRATDPIVEARVQAILQIRLDGAQTWDCRAYVAEKETAGEQPWTLKAGETPLSERQIRNYVTTADKLLSESNRTSRKEQLRQHRAQRKSLYARAVNSGDIRTALAVLADLARLAGLYPAERVKVKHSGKIKDGDKLTAEQRKAALDHLSARLGNRGDSPAPNRNGTANGHILGGPGPDHDGSGA